ncbi:MAG: branched-chain amino acid ABC transporter permease [Chloroflexota bacterium]|nr:branched-chain amino acid ABC transporter permease [Anaerolineales bacterium]MCB8965759.1 branched-chain amino acid ABC transporter permease [Ardenticatenaceae bacterium]
MNIILQNIVSGLLVGGVYGLAALGLSLAFGVLKVLNIAHGELIMFGGYIAFFAFSAIGVDPFLSILIVFPVLVIFGLVLHGTLFTHIVRFEEEDRIKNSLLIGFGLTLILQTIAIQLFSADERSILTAYSSAGFELGGIRFPLIRLGALLLAIVSVVLLEIFLNRTWAGRALRATSENWQTAALNGINVRQTYFIAFGLAAGLAGLTGVLLATGFSVAPSIGLQWTLKALIVVVLAGLGSIRGALFGGLLLGVAEALSAYAFGSEYREIIGLIMFVIVLSVRPQGLFGGDHA